MKMKGFSFVILLFFVFETRAQLISRKESDRVENLLVELSEKLKPKRYHISNVNVLSMNDSLIRPNQHVFVRDGIIESIDTNSSKREGYEIIDGTGKYLMPGLADMHVHLFDKHPMKNTWMLLLVLNGVTTIRDMGGESAKLGLRDQISRSEIFGPTIYQAGPIIDGAKDKHGLYAFAITVEQGRQLVNEHKNHGYDFIKVYDGLRKDVYEAILDEALKTGLPVAGHLPRSGTIADATNGGHTCIEHLTGYFQWKKFDVELGDVETLAQQTANSAMWNCPTLYNHFLNTTKTGVESVLNDDKLTKLLPIGLVSSWKKRYSTQPKEVIEMVDLQGDNTYRKIESVVTALHLRNANLVAGTDSGNLPFLVPGYSLHQELKRLQRSGMSHYDVLKAATVNAGSLASKERNFGTIAVGKRADLLLLNENPLESLDNLEKRAAIFLHGIWISEAENQRVRTELSKIFGHQ